MGLSFNVCGCGGSRLWPPLGAAFRSMPESPGLELERDLEVGMLLGLTLGLDDDAWNKNKHSGEEVWK